MIKNIFVLGNRNGFIASAARVATETPQFTGPIDNVTVALGREAILSCSVTDLGNYKVS